jgi:transcription initiation factor TFIIIB Brf1 subunit/transcription initiation factor TFIIB
VVQPEKVIDETREWREFAPEEGGGQERSRAEKVDEEFQSLGTEISSTNFGSNTISQTAKSLSKYSKMASTEESRVEQYLKESFVRINELCELLGLSQLIKQSAKEVLKVYDKKRSKNTKGHRKDAFLVAILLIACKKHHCGRTIRTLSRAAFMDERDVKKYYKNLLKDPSLLNVGNGEKSMEREVAELVEVIGNKLGQPFSIIREAKGISAQGISFLEGKRPASIAAASLLYALSVTSEDIKHNDVCVAAGVSINTLRNVFKELRLHVDYPVYEQPAS